MTCTNKQYIQIFKGDDTNWNNEIFLNVTVISELDLSEMTAKFILGSYTESFPLSTPEFSVSLSRAVTGAFAYGPIDGVIQIIDSEKRIKTVTNTIPFFVTNKVIDEQDVNYQCNVSPNSPIEIIVNAGGGSGKAEWGFITGTLSDQEDLQEALDAKQNVIPDLYTIRTGAALGATAVQPETLESYATKSELSTGLSTKQDTLTPAQQDAVDSGIDSTKVGQIATNTSNISTIEGKIPAQASAENQLADKNFVNSSIATNTANFIGTFESLADLEGYSGTVTNNDYAFVVNSVITDNGSDWATFAALNAYDKTLLTNFDYAWVENGSKFDLYRFDIVEQSWDLRAQDIHKDTSLLNTAYNRYKATVSGSTVTWQFEYTLNNSSFTAAQWAAINSGITDTAVTQIGTNTTNIGTLQSDKQPKTLATPITVESVSQTTVEGALGAINTLAEKGLQNKSTNADSVTLSNKQITTTGEYSVFITPHKSTNTSGNYSVCIGSTAGVTDGKSNVVAIGYNVTAGGVGSTAIGHLAYASGGSSASEMGATSVGQQASATWGTALGAFTQASGSAVAVGRGYNSSHRVKASANKSIAIGCINTSDQVCEATAEDAIQLGNGNNSTASTFQVYSYPMLDGTTGKIPNARLNLDSALDTSSTNPVENGAVATALNSKISYALTIREW